MFAANETQIIQIHWVCRLSPSPGILNNLKNKGPVTEVSSL
jgi:hypothetical protein